MLGHGFGSKVDLQGGGCGGQQQQQQQQAKLEREERCSFQLPQGALSTFHLFRTNQMVGPTILNSFQDQPDEVPRSFFNLTQWANGFLVTSPKLFLDRARGVEDHPAAAILTCKREVWGCLSAHLKTICS